MNTIKTLWGDFSSAAAAWFTESRSGRVVVGLACVGMGAYCVVAAATSSDHFVASVGFFAPLVLAFSPLFVILGLRLAFAGLRGSDPKSTQRPWPRAVRIAFGAYLVLGTVACALWVMPTLQSDRLLTGFDREIAISVGDPVILMNDVGPPDVEVVGAVATAGNYDRRHAPEYTYVGLDLAPTASEAANDAEPRILEDAFRSSYAELLRAAGVRPGPSGSVVMLLREN